MPPDRIRATAVLLTTVLLRIAFGVGVVIVVAGLALAIPRWARPELYVGETGVGGVLHAMGRAFFHFDFGVACGWVGCPRVRDMWLRGYAADVWMLFGTVAIGVGAGFALGLWCAARSGSRRARFVENAAVGPLLRAGVCHRARNAAAVQWHVRGVSGALLLRRRAGLGVAVRIAVGLVPHDARAMARGRGATRGDVRCGSSIALLREQEGTDHVRTAIAKGVPHKRVIRHHAGPFARSAIASLVGVSAPIVVLNLILVERVFSVPGFFLHT